MNTENSVEIENIDVAERDIFTDSTEELENNDIQLNDDTLRHMLSSGDALDEEELYVLTAKKNTRIIYILGPVGSGKTTFEAMIYQCFLKNIDDELWFAGSETLQGYERRLNNLRLISGNSAARMERTNIKERNCFLQLHLYNKYKQENYSIVFADISGEIFNRCTANKTNMEEDLINLDLAQNIVLFIDGEALLDKSRRQGAVSQLRTFLQTLKSSNLYSPNCCIDIVISKNDIIYNKLKEDKEHYIENIENKFNDLKDDFVIRFYRIEALNGNNISDTTNSTSLIKLLKSWLNTNDKEDIRYIIESSTQELKNEFNRFGEKG